MRLSLAVLIVCLYSPALPAQRSVFPNPGAERIILVVPITGSADTAGDPRRPWLLPARGLPPGILSYSWLPSDDGRLAIVELTARDRSAFASFASAIASDRRPELRLFDPHRHSRLEVETALKLVKRGFRLELFRGLGQ